MKNFTKLLMFIAAMLIGANLVAQEVLVVEPGVGTLNAAITANGGDKIYQLQAGEWYQLDAIIENVDYHLQIIGEEPADGGIPATVQTNADAGGAVFGTMFDAKGDITLKNIYIVNADLTGVIGGAFLNQSKNDGRVIVNNCVIDPVSNGNGLIINSGNAKLYFTDNLAIRMGHQLNPNDGHFFVTDNASGQGIDTMLVENNTFVCMGTTMHAGGFNKYVHNYLKWNHNTFVLQKSQIDWSIWENEYFWTNNLMFDVQTQPWNTPWQPMPGADVNKPKPALIYADTIPGEELPSSRIQFVQYNMHYRNPGFYDLVETLNAQGAEDGKTVIYLMPIIWPIDSIDIARETEMFNNPESFPLWKYGNTMTDIDPGWVDQDIYAHSDVFVEWTNLGTQIHAMGYPSDLFPPASEWPQWHWDPDGDVSNNEAWPVFNGVYTNPELMKASIESLPLGDLNWFPTAKAVWEENKAAIDAHMQATNVDKLNFGWNPVSVGPDKVTKAFSVYPNPVSDILYVSNGEKVNVTIMNVVGSVVKRGENVSSIKVSDLANGVYFVRINNKDVYKFMISR